MVELRRNNSSKPLISNGEHRNGQMDWHNGDCQIEDYGISRTPQPHRQIWCATHGQWAHETPVVVRYVFADGTVVERRTEP
jgi:hypothetical protein